MKSHLAPSDITDQQVTVTQTVVPVVVETVSVAPVHATKNCNRCGTTNPAANVKCSVCSFAAFHPSKPVAQRFGKPSACEILGLRPLTTVRER